MITPDMNIFEKGLGRYMNAESLSSIANITIGIAGCGGIGSNCAHNLVRCGFKHFVLVDPDCVEPSNLNRQFYFTNQCGQPKVDMLKQNLLAINSNLLIQAIQTEIISDNIESIFYNCDAIVEAFDAVVSKKLLAEKYLNSNRLVVSVSGIAGSGNADDIVCKKVNHSFYMVGDFRSEVTEKVHPYSPKTNIAAAKQADIIFHYFKQ